MSGSRLPRHGRARPAAALAITSAGAATATAWAAWHLALLVPWAVSHEARGPAGPLLAVACLLAAVVLGRLCLAALATTVCGAAAWVASARSSRGRTRELCAWFAVSVSPRLVRPLVASVLAGTVALGTAASANATSTPGVRPTHVGTSAGSSSPDAGADQLTLPDPGWSSNPARDVAASALPAPTWTPQRPPAPRRDPVDVSAVAAAPSRTHEPAPVVVRRGDTLWSIAARALGAGATDADVAREWPRWWRANRATVGPDPDLLHPGQVLAPPTSEGVR